MLFRSRVHELDTHAWGTPICEAAGLIVAERDGQVEIVWSTTKSIRPEPFPLSRTRDEWESFLDDLRVSWDGQWNPPKTMSPPTH